MRQVLDTVYGTGPAGLPGNDDLGTMSAWYVFSALGIYPRTPGSATLLLGTPVFPEAVLDRPGRKDIVIGAPEADDTHTYVDGVRHNGRTVPGAWVGPALTMRGGRLDFRLAPKPDTSWATAGSDLPE